jgi:MraZ protein
MLLGEYKHTIDEKGRMAVPAKFREKFDSGAIITRGLDHCLFIFSAGEWDSLVRKLVALPLAQADSRAFARLMLSGAADVRLDAQGRVLIPEHLREYARLEKNAVVTGVYTRMEIWNAEDWRTYKEKTESAADEIAEKLGELGI